MRIEKSIVSAWAEILTQAAAGDAVDYLQTLNDDLASGDYRFTGWESICIQVRGAYTAFWRAYQDLIDSSLSNHLESRSTSEKLALWAQTDEGRDWIYDHYTNEDGHTTAPVDESAILLYLRAAVLSAADEYESEVVNQFLYPDAL